MIRASSAEDAELCGYIRVLQQRHPRTYRNTLLGTAYHAKQSKAPDAALRMERLTDAERAEVDSWLPPDDYRDEEGPGSVLLRYTDAQVERPVGLSGVGGYMSVTPDASDPAGYVDDPDLLVPATVDMWWSYEHPIRGRTVAVADLKTGEHAIAHGAMNLQFVAPALALADREGADWYRTGIWYVREARWEWGPAVSVTSELAVQQFQRLRRAATNPPVPVVGSHCTECFQRGYCDAYVLPASQAETDLAPLTKPGGLTVDNAMKAHMMLQALGKMVDTGKDTLKAWLEVNGPVALPDGKVLRLEDRAGREYADTALLKADGLTRYLKRSRPSQSIAVRKA